MAVDHASIEPITNLDLSSLDNCDVALMNLRAARGLPGAEALDEEAMLTKLDEWARQCKFEIWRHLYRINHQIIQPPTEFSYGNSLGHLFCWYMLQVLQEDCGVAYHPDRKFDPDFCNPEDIFIHGIVGDGGKGGTCSSMPVVYVAVGQRLGLPVQLVQTRGHLFFRWDDPKGTLLDWDTPHVQIWIPPDKFNIDGSGEGIAYHEDEHYRTWPEEWTEGDRQHGRYLRSMNKTEVLAEFLIERGECFYDLGDWNECLKAIYFARKLVPDDLRFEWLHKQRSMELRAVEASKQRVIEHQQETRRMLDALLGIPGHSRRCGCLDCENAKRAALHLHAGDHGERCSCGECRHARQILGVVTGAPDHPGMCGCQECDQYREMARFGAVPPHSLTCRCMDCTQAKVKYESARRMPGHSVHCACIGCSERARRGVRGNGNPEFGTVRHMSMQHEMNLTDDLDPGHLE